MTQTSEIQQNTSKLLEFTYNKFLNNKLDNNSLVQQIELNITLLNLLTIPNYAKKYNMSYNGVKKFRNIITIAGIKFVIDND